MCRVELNNLYERDTAECVYFMPIEVEDADDYPPEQYRWSPYGLAGKPIANII